MLSLLLSTLAMMGLTFVIGFFVAGVIKIIANWADLLAFYNLHQKELQHLKKAGIIRLAPVSESKFYDNGTWHWAHRLNEAIHNLKPRRRIAA